MKKIVSFVLSFPLLFGFLLLMLVALAGIAVAVYSLWGGVSDETAS